MRTRIKIFCGLALAAICLLVWLHYRTEPTSVSPQEETTPTGPQSANRPAESPAVEKVRTPGLSHTPATSAAGYVTPNSATEEIEGHKRKLLDLWQGPIDFYGKSVDENGNPVGGVSVHFRWEETPTEEGMRTSTVESGPDGLFSLYGKLGRSLTVQVSKTGYYASHGGQQTFLYGALDSKFSPDLQNPVIFPLRKRGPGAELITSENGMRLKVNVRIPRDNTPIRVDLLQKQASAAGQLEISQNKPPWREATEWSFRMSIPGGGFVENEDEFQFEAPKSNYKPTMEYNFTKSETNWITHFTGKYYIAFGEPRKYGWLRIESDLTQETIFLTYAINPTGSRNLEPRN